jgi:tetraacyldisaccharide-1-P 4'-kinase
MDALAGRKVLSACALGNPAHFHGMVERAGARIMRRFELRDHRAFSAAELDAQASAAGAEAIVLSRKDLVKLHEMPKRPVFVPELGLRFLDVESDGRSGASALRTAINAAATRACASSRGSR